MAGWMRLVGLLLALVPGLALGAIELDTDSVRHPVERELRFVRDDQARLGVEQVLALPTSAWRDNDDDVFSRGYNDAAWWLRFDVRRLNVSHDRDLLEVAYPVLDHVDVWVLHQGRVQAHYRMGDKQPFASRPIAHRYFLVPLTMQVDETYTVLLRVRTASSVQVPITLWENRAYVAHDQWRLMGLGLYFGAMLVMVIYNFFVFLIVRERNYFYYVMYVLSILLFMASLNGIAYQFLWPRATTWNDEAIILTLTGTLLFGTLFTMRFLQLPRYLPWLVPAMRLLIAASLLLMVAAFLLTYDVVIRLAIVVGALACLGGFLASALRWRQGDATARVYTIAWSFVLLGGFVMALNKFQVLPQNLFTENSVLLGSALEVVLLSFALAERINEEKRLRFNAQQSALEAERKTRHAQAEALDAQRQANERLEQRVQERTEALEEANRRLAELSATDQLTGLRNRRYLDTLLHEEFQRCHRYSRSIALLLLDIDHFKRFNDSYGHMVGDDCLRAVADSLRQAVRTEVDRVARFGGEEFCLVLPETDAEGASVVAERIRAAVQALDFHVDGKPVPVTVSVGVAALVPASADDVQLLLLNTDKALYEAKAAGRNCVRLAS